MFNKIRLLCFYFLMRLSQFLIDLISVEILHYILQDVLQMLVKLVPTTIL